MGSLWQDMRFAFRSFARQPALTLIAVLSLGLGIGATATVFTWLQGFVFDPLPAIPSADRLVVAHTLSPDKDTWTVSWPDFQDWRAGTGTADPTSSRWRPCDAARRHVPLHVTCCGVR
ncbi:MAG: hypothetical protein ABL994_10375, partial [Verrucomicrobiales bacterium]